MQGPSRPDSSSKDPAENAYTRREFLVRSGKAGAAGAIAATVPIRLLTPPAQAAPAGVLTKSERRTLRAAVARIVPAEGPGDWSAAEVGADEYIVGLLAGTGHIFAGGPTRRRFPRFQRLPRVKRIGWSREVRRLRKVYRRGLKELDARAGGDFASAPAPTQDAILTQLDDQRDPFFNALYENTMEGVYGHPVYGGNRNFRAWRQFAYQGDVHGVRFPGIGPEDAPWNVFGGYAPEEMAKPGKGP
jgi:gluconate 2-dehydrogenase gamma chain